MFRARRELERLGRLVEDRIDPGKVVGQIGEVRSEITPEDMGSVYVGGELWTARARTAIPAGSPVRVVALEGLILLVEKVEPPFTQ